MRERIRVYNIFWDLNYQLKLLVELVSLTSIKEFNAQEYLVTLNNYAKMIVFRAFLTTALIYSNLIIEVWRK